MELKGNSGLELPANIGELGDGVKKMDLSNHNLQGASQPGAYRALKRIDFTRIL